MKLRIASFLILSIVAFMSCSTQPTVDRSTFTGEYRPTMTNTVIDTPKTTNANVNLNANASTASKTFTMSEVAAKNTKDACYYVIFGKVYDVTAWGAKHPGGAEAIIENCGKDISGKSIGYPGGQFDSTKLQEILKEYYIGDLKA